jgi:F-type H+-transporting ATPase subunit gamma
MDNPNDLEQQLDSTKTLVGLTSVLEGLASIKISQVKNQVIQSKEFFGELWHIYSQLRVDSKFHFGRNEKGEKTKNKDLIIIVTAEGGLSGDIDQKLISLFLQAYNEKEQDIIVIGHHGAIQLAQQNIHFKRYYKLPTKDKDINVGPIVAEVQQYKSTKVYYQTYVSLMVQDVKRIELSAVVQEQGRAVAKGDEEISEKNYIFEPSTFAVIDHLERSMLYIALEQVILESKLAQYASRFQAMTKANDKAKTMMHETKGRYRQAKRKNKDSRLKETVNNLRGAAVV